MGISNKVSKLIILSIFGLMAVRELLIFSFLKTYVCSEVSSTKHLVLTETNKFHFRRDVWNNPDSLCRILALIEEDKKNYLLFAPGRSNRVMVHVTFVHQDDSESRATIYLTSENRCVFRTTRGNFSWNVFESPRLQEMLFYRE